MTSATLNASNLIGTLGAFTTGSGFALTNNQSLSVSGLVKDTGAASTLAITTTTGDLTLAGGVTATHAVDLVSAGAITQTGGIITAASLTGSALTSATLNASNLIGTLGGFTASSGDFSLLDAAAVTLTGTVSASGNVNLTDSNSAGITFNAGALTAGSGKQVTLIADALSVTSSGTLSAPGGGTVQIVPYTVSNTIDFGVPGVPAVPGTLIIDPAAVLITTNGGTLRLGRSGFSGPITFGAASDLSTAAGTLDLQTSGAVTQASGATVKVGTLAGNVGSLTWSESNNQIGTLGGFTVTAGDFALTDKTALTVSGSLSANNITLSDGAASGSALSVSGALGGGAGKTVKLTASDPLGGIALSGTVNATSTGVLDLNAGSGGVTQTGGSITAGTLKSTGGVGGTVALSAPTVSNSIGQVTGFIVTGGDYSLSDGIGLTVAGPLSANNITLTDAAASASAISVTGSLTGGASDTVKLTASNAAGGIALSGNVSASSTGTLDLNAGSGGVTQSAGSITAGTLQSSNGVNGSVTLNALSNSIGAVAGFTVTGINSFVLTDGSPLTVSGPLSAWDVTLTDSAASASAISVTGSLTGNSGVTSSSFVNLIASNAVGGIALSGNVAGIGGGALYFDVTAGSGGVMQTAGSINAFTLNSTGGVGGSVVLTQSGDQIRFIGFGSNFAVTGGDFTLNDSAAVSVSGALSANNITLTDSAPSTPNAIAIPGSLTGGAGDTVKLTASDPASGIFLMGAVSATSTGTLDLNAGSDGVYQTAGSVAAGTLKSSNGVSGYVTLNAPTTSNSIGQVTGFAVTGGDFSLSDGISLTVAGPLSANNITLTDSAASVSALSVTGSLTGGAGDMMKLTASNATGGIALSGTVNATPTGTLDLNAGSGGVTQTAGAVTAGTLQSSGSIGGPIVLTQSGNSIGAIGGLTVIGAGFSFSDASQLTISGPLSANNINLTDSASSASAISVTGSLSGGAGNTVKLTASNAAGGVRTSGAVSATATGTLDVTAGSGGVAQTAGSIIAGTLTSSGGVGGTVALNAPTTSNSIGAVTGFTVTGADFNLSDGIGLTVSGLLANNITLTDAASSGSAISVTGSLTGGAGDTVKLTASNAVGGIALSGTVNATATGALDVNAGSGGVTQTVGSIAAGILKSSNGVSGAVALNASTTSNSIDSLAGFTITAADFALSDGIALTVAGSLSANNITLTDAAASGSAISVTGSLTGGVGDTVKLTASNASGGIALSGAANATATGTLDLNAGSGGVNQTAGSISAGSLHSSSGVTGAVALNAPTTSNSIGQLTGFTVAGADFSLSDGIALTVTGPLSANNITLTDSLASASAISVTGSMTGGVGKTTTLTAGDAAGGITLSGTVNATGTGTLDLNAGSGGVTQTAGSMTVGTLKSSNGIGGAVSLTGLNNQIGGLGTITLTSGDFSLNDAGALTVSGTTSAGNVHVTNSAVGGITFAGGKLASGTGGLVFVQTDAMSVSSTGTLSAPGGGTIQITPYTSSATLNYGGASATVPANLTLDTSGTGIVRLGQVGFTGNIAFDAAANFSGAAALLDLLTTGGAVSQLSGAGVTVGTLTGTVGSMALNVVGASNSIANLGNITASVGDFRLTDTTALNVLGTLDVPTGTVVLTDTAAGSSAINLASSGTIDPVGNTIQLVASNPTGGIQLSGVVTTGTSGGLPVGTLDINAGSGGVTQNSGSTITTGNLISSLGVGGTVLLTQSANQIVRVGNLTVSSGDFTLTDSIDLTVSGALAATLGNVSLTGAAADATALSVAGSLATGSGKSATLLASNAAGGIGFSGTLNVGTLDVTAGSGGVTQTAGSITAGTLQSSGGVNSAVALNAPITSNSIVKVAGFAVTGADFTLSDGILLNVSGPLSANNITLTDAASSPSAISVTGMLSGGSGDTVKMTASDVAGGIVLSGTVNATATGTLDLNAGSGGVTQTAGSITAGTLTSSGGVGGAIMLSAPTTSNSIGKLAGFAVTGADFALSDGIDLTVLGPLVANNITLTDGAADATAISVTGTVTGGGGKTTKFVASNAAGGIALSGAVNATATGTLDVNAGSGGVTQTAGSITAGTVKSSGGVSGAVALNAPTISNNIGALGGLSSNGLKLSNAANLQVTGAVNAGSGSTTINNGTFSFDVNTGVGITSTGDINVAAGAVTIAGSVTTLGNIIFVPVSFSSTGSLQAGGVLTITIAGTGLLDLEGTVTAPQIVATTKGNATLGGTYHNLGGTFTSAAARLNLPLSAFPTASSPGLYLSADQGISTVGNVVVAASTPPAANLDNITLVTTGTSSITLGNQTTKGGIYALTTNSAGVLGTANGILFLELGTGTVTGNVYVDGLNVSYQRPGTTQKALLYGQVGGAAYGFIKPIPSNNYLLNNCPIGQIQCVSVTVETPPMGNPLPNIQVAQPPDDDFGVVFRLDTAKQDY